MKNYEFRFTYENGNKIERTCGARSASVAWETAAAWSETFTGFGDEELKSIELLKVYEVNIGGTVRCLEGVNFEKMTGSEISELKRQYIEGFRRAMLFYDYDLVGRSNMEEVLEGGYKDKMIPLVSEEEVLLNNFLSECWNEAEDKLFNEIYESDDDDEDENEDEEVF